MKYESLIIYHLKDMAMHASNIKVFKVGQTSKSMSGGQKL
jgi:hypothetical protein